MTSLVLCRGIGFAALSWLALRFCAAAVLVLAIVIGLVFVWAVASVAIAIIGDVPTRRSVER